MGNEDRLARFVRSTARGAGRRYAEAIDAYRSARAESGLPQDEEGRVRIVCRRHVERRRVLLDDEARPACYDADHPDCEGCVEDIRDGRIQTW